MSKKHSSLGMLVCLLYFFSNSADGFFWAIPDIFRPYELPKKPEVLPSVSPARPINPPSTLAQLKESSAGDSGFEESGHGQTYKGKKAVSGVLAVKGPHESPAEGIGVTKPPSVPIGVRPPTGVTEPSEADVSGAHREEEVTRLDAALGSPLKVADNFADVSSSSDPVVLKTNSSREDQTSPSQRNEAPVDTQGNPSPATEAKAIAKANTAEVVGDNGRIENDEPKLNNRETEAAQPNNRGSNMWTESTQPDSDNSKHHDNNSKDERGRNRYRTPGKTMWRQGRNWLMSHFSLTTRKRLPGKQFSRPDSKSPRPNSHRHADSVPSKSRTEQSKQFAEMPHPRSVAPSTRVRSESPTRPQPRNDIPLNGAPHNHAFPVSIFTPANSGICSCNCNNYPAKDEQDPSCEWKMVFKAVAGSEFNVSQDFTNTDYAIFGDQFGRDITSPVTFIDGMTLYDWGTLSIHQVKMEIYASGERKAWFIFDGVGTNIKSWMTQDRMLATSFNRIDFDGECYEVFGVGPHDAMGTSESFSIYRSGSSCSDGCGLVTVIEPGAADCTMSSQPRPYFLYSDSSSCTDWSDTDSMHMGDRLVISVKICDEDW